jgi:hypothetical protein
MLRKLYVIAFAVSLLFTEFINAQQGVLINTEDQQQLLKAYRLILEKSADDYHDGSTVNDQELFPAFGEHSKEEAFVYSKKPRNGY